MQTATILTIVFYLLLIDALGANVVSWLGFRKWYTGNFRLLSKYFPATRGWTTYYLVLVIFIGWIINSYVITLF